MRGSKKKRALIFQGDRLAGISTLQSNIHRLPGFKGPVPQPLLMSIQYCSILFPVCQYDRVPGSLQAGVGNAIYRNEMNL